LPLAWLPTPARAGRKRVCYNAFCCAATTAPSARVALPIWRFADRAISARLEA